VSPSQPLRAPDVRVFTTLAVFVCLDEQRAHGYVSAFAIEGGEGQIGTS
jgi:hypothetical protein